MRLDFALYGERRGAHELLSTSLKDEGPAVAIRGKTDRPPFMPPGFSLQPFTSSFSDGRFYIFTKTFPDLSAARSGMVTTIAILVDIAEVIQISNIGGILSRLPEQPVDECPVSLDQECSLEDSELLIPSRQLVEALVSPGARKTVVWVGDEFEPQLTSLWRLLWPEARRNFSHRLTFDPQDLSVDQPTIVTVPDVLESRWSDFRVAQHIPRSTRTLAGDALLDVDEGRNVRQMVGKLEIAIRAPKDIVPLVNIAQTYNNPASKLDQLRSSMHTLARLCPDSTVGIEVKSRLVDLIVEAIRKEDDVSEIRAFRNLDLEPFATSARVREAIRQWIAANIPKDTDEALIRSSFDQLNKLSTTFALGFKDALKSISTKSAIQALNRWLRNLPGHASSLLHLAIESSIPDKDLSGINWKLPETEAVCLLADKLLDRYPYTRSAIIALSLPLESAVQYLGASRLEPNDPELAVFLSRVDIDEMYALALSSLEQPNAIAAGCILIDDRLIASIDMADSRSLGALGLALDAGLDGSKINPIALSRMLIGLTSVELPFERSATLWRLVLERRVSLLSLEHRSSCWGRIPEFLRPQFLSDCADEWISTLKEGERAETPEPELERVIVQRLRAGPPRASLISSLVHSLPSFDEETFASILINRPRIPTLDRVSAELIGEVAQERGWRRAAERIYDAEQIDSQLQPVLARCYELLGRMRRLHVRLFILGAERTPTESELWTTLEELALELYPWGPGEYGVWERAGGDPSLVRFAATGAESWHDIITFARNGGGGVTLKSLCDAMAREYWANDVLQRLQEYVRKR